MVLTLLCYKLLLLLLVGRNADHSDGEIHDHDDDGAEQDDDDDDDIEDDEVRFVITV